MRADDARAGERSRWPIVAATGGLLVAALAGKVTIEAGASWPVVVESQLVGLAYLLAGTIAFQRRPDNAVGALLLIVGYAWYLPDFQSSASPAVAATAYANRRLVNFVSGYLLLAFPSGRLGSPWARLATAVNLAGIAVDSPARWLLTDRIPADLRHADRIAAPGCDCRNPFQIAEAPDVLASIESTLAALSVATSLLIIGIVVHRLATATVPMRRTLAPVVLAAIVAIAAFGFNLTADHLGGSPAMLDRMRWLLTLARAAVPIGFMVGLLRMKIGRAAVADMVVRMQGEPSLASLQSEVAGALGDPGVQLGYWSPAGGAYLDAAGRELAMPAGGSKRSATFVGDASRRLGVIVHDEALQDDRALLDAVSAAFAIAVDRERLTTSLRAQARDALRLPGGPVTFLYADIEGSTRLLARLGDRYGNVLSEQRRLLRAAVRDHGGVEIDSRADEFFAVFADAGDPIGAALAIHRALRDRAWPGEAEVKVRIGLHGGEPQRTEEGYVGLDVHRASRIGSAGHGAQTLLSQAARDRHAARLPGGTSLRRLGAFRLKDLPEADTLWQLETSDLPRDFPPLRSSRAGD